MYFADYFFSFMTLLVWYAQSVQQGSSSFSAYHPTLVTDYMFLGVTLELLVQGYTLAWLLSVSRYPRQWQVFVSNRTVEDSYPLLWH